MESLFIGHGSPMNAIETNPYTRYLNSLGKAMETPECVVVFSAHWLTRGTFVTGSPAPQQIYDFYGFPDELYRVAYRPRGNPEIAAAINAALPEIGVDGERGIDHAGWAVLTHMYPDQNVPVIEMSLDVQKSDAQHYELGKKIAALGMERVLFLGSGNLIHNLYEVSFEDQAKPFGWAEETNGWLEKTIRADAVDELLRASERMPNYKKAVPSKDHFWPMLYVLGMKQGSLSVRYNEIQNASISMLSFSA